MYCLYPLLTTTALLHHGRLSATHLAPCTANLASPGVNCHKFHVRRDRLLLAPSFPVARLDALKNYGTRRDHHPIRTLPPEGKTNCGSFCLLAEECLGCGLGSWHMKIRTSRQGVPWRSPCKDLQAFEILSRLGCGVSGVGVWTSGLGFGFGVLGLGFGA